MHSDLTQAQRDSVMHEFRNGRVDVLVATDIVSRGIDIDDIPLVINYDVPSDAEDYVHRIGRTARAANSGMAITLVSENDQTRFKAIEDFLEKDIYKIPLPDGMEAPPYAPKRKERYRRPGGNKQQRKQPQQRWRKKAHHSNKQHSNNKEQNK